MASRDRNLLLPRVRAKLEKMELLCSEKRLDFLVTCTYRSDEEQDTLYSQGRELLVEVNKKRKRIGLFPITEKENKIVTYAKAGQSNHNLKADSTFVNAFDIVPVIGGKLIWDKEHIVWRWIAKIGKRCGLSWAGKWKRFKEYPHFEG